jgi:hypothetical protein
MLILVYYANFMLSKPFLMLHGIEINGMTMLRIPNVGFLFEVGVYTNILQLILRVNSLCKTAGSG